MSDQGRTPTPSGARRIPPNPDKPALPARIERQLAPADERSAQAYTALEDANAELLALIDQQAAPTKELEVTDSLVHRVLTGVAPKKEQA